MMQVKHELRNLLIVTLICFVIVALAAAYQAVPGAEGILNRDDNPRLVEDIARIQRGTIYDRQNTPITETIVDGLNPIDRQYLYPETSSFTGYFSLRYGEGGAESAFDDILSGDTLPIDFATRFEQDALHRSQRGSDIRLTLDLTLQQYLYTAMEEYTGGAVILSIPTGGVMSLVSLPTFNPNTLDEEWDVLIQAPEEPFFNRVLQGSYQPGGLLQTPILTAAILRGTPLDTNFQNANSPVQLPDITVVCATDSPATEMTITEAHAYGCPEPFAQLTNTLGQATLTDILRGYRFDEPSALPEFIGQLPDENGDFVEATPEVTPEASTITYSLTEQAMGQAGLTVNPMSIARMTAAIMNGGNAPRPITLMAQRPPDGTWQPVNSTRSPVAMITVETASRLQTIFRRNMQQGAASSAYHEGVTMGGHAALAYSGEGTQAWFTGYIRLGDTRGAVIAIVIEDTDDIETVAQIGGEALIIARDILQQEQNQN